MPPPLPRRRFLGAAGLVAGAAITRPLLGAEAPSNDIHIGCIGVGSRGSVHVRALLATGFRVAAICDLKPERVKAAQDVVEQAGQPRPFGTAEHNWDVMNWANRCAPKRAMGMGRDDRFRDKQHDRNVHDYYSGVLEYENGVIVNIIHSWVAPGGIDREYTQLIGAKGGIDFNPGSVTFRREDGRPPRGLGKEAGAYDNTQLAFAAFANSVRTRAPALANPETGRAAVLTCLLMREAVRRGTVVTPKDIGAG